MDSFEFNKIAMAVLGTVFVMFGVGLISEAIFSTEAPEHPGYTIAATESSGTQAAAKPSGPGYDPISPLLASADVAKGEKISAKCHACHDLTKGGPNKVGPNLYGVVGRPIASHEGFSYSSGMKDFAAEHKDWTYQLLNGFLHNPRKFVHGTAMGFAGVKKTQDRADLVAYLRTLADNPVPLPSADSAAKTDEGDAAAQTGDNAAAQTGDNAGSDTQAPAADTSGSSGD